MSDQENPQSPESILDRLGARAQHGSTVTWKLFCELTGIESAKVFGEGLEVWLEFHAHCRKIGMPVTTRGMNDAGFRFRAREEVAPTFDSNAKRASERISQDSEALMHLDTAGMDQEDVVVIENTQNRLSVLGAEAKRILRKESRRPGSLGDN